MSYIIFGVGISLFVASAISGLVQNRTTETATFGALGITNFVVLFIFSPSARVQKALSNLLQAQIIYQDFWDQIRFWAPYGISEKPEEKKTS